MLKFDKDDLQRDDITLYEKIGSIILFFLEFLLLIFYISVIKKKLKKIPKHYFKAMHISIMILIPGSIIGR